MIKKPQTTLLLLIIILPAATATETTTATLTPGETNTIQENITIDNTTIEQAETTANPFPFPITYDNNQLTATPEVDTPPPGTYTGDLILETDDTEETTTIEKTLELTVEEYNNWTATLENKQDTLSIGSSGEFAEINLSQQGNAQQTITAETTGNLSQHLSHENSFTLTPTANHTFRIDYDIPRGQEFGEQNTTVELSGDNHTETFNLTAELEDNIEPTIEDFHFPDVMATQTAQFTVAADDNIGVENVSAEITRETTDGNQTEVEGSPFEFEVDEETGLWTLEFDQTGEIAEYQINVTAEDESNNTAFLNETFEVEGLDAVQMLDNDLSMEAIWSDQSTENTVFELEEETDVDITLSQFSYGGNNTVDIGIKHEDADNPEVFEEEEDTITVSQEGEYTLSVQSYSDQPVDETNNFQGELELETVPQHVTIDDTVLFSGQINTDDNPQPQNIQLGEFEGFIGYQIPDEFEHLAQAESSDNVVFIGTLDRSQCVGDTEWSECTSFSMGEFERIEDDINQAAFIRNVAVGFSILQLVILAMYVKSKENIGKLMVRKPVKT